MKDLELKQLSWMRLPRSLSALETWGFGLTGHVGWIGTAPVIHAALGTQALWVWIPGVIISVLLNLQVQRLGKQWPEMAGGAPNYAARLLKAVPGLGPYVAIGYYLGWVAAPVVYAIVLTDLITANLQPLGISCPTLPLKIGFTAIAFIVGLSGTNALSLLHLFFVIPAVVSLLLFCLQGIGWLAMAPESPGLWPTELAIPSLSDWAKYFFISVYSVYSCETGASFVADSRRPAETLRFLSFAAWLIPPVFVGGSWVMMQLAAQPGNGDNLYLNLLAASRPFWGAWASSLVTLLVAFCCLLSSATAVANTPRVLYQLAVDGHLSPVFALVSRRGVLEPALWFTFALSLLCLAWGDLSQVVMITGTGYLVSMMGLHLGLWLNRHQPHVRWPWWSLLFFCVEAVVLVVGGISWGVGDLLVGLLLPAAILLLDRAIRRLPVPMFRPQWWWRRYARRTKTKIKDFVCLQVAVLLLIIAITATIGWFVGSEVNSHLKSHNHDLLIILLITLAFVGVAIACWTTLPQIAAIDEAREQTKDQFQAVLDAVPGAVSWVSSDLKYLGVNEFLAKTFNLKPENFIGQEIGFLGSSPQFVNLVQDFFSNSKHKISSQFEAKVNGNRRTYLIIAQKYAEEQAAVFAGIDITERRATEEALRESEERYALAIRGTNDGLWDWNLLTNEVYFSPRWKSMLDYEENEIGSNLNEWFDRVHPGDIERLKMEVSRYIAGLTTHFETEYRILTRQKIYSWMLSRGFAVRDESGKAYRMVGSQTDITDRKMVEEQLLHDALHDALTGLPNRVAFMERLTHAIALARRLHNYSFAVLFLDFDRFKVINDSLGHLVGDRLLIEIADRLKLCLRSGDMVARLGGDEFTILLDNLEKDSDATQIAERIQATIKQPFKLSGHQVFTSVSIGIALSSHCYEKAEDLLRDADIAMYCAKASGKAQHKVFNEIMHAHAVALLQIETDLRYAIDREEFQLYYQPIVSIPTQDIVGFEALLRWQHPKRGFVSPGEFIPVAEENGLIIPIGWWVLKKACQQMREWQLEFPEYSHLVINVNLSSKQFIQPNFVSKIKEILTVTKLHPGKLKLEITETAVMENAEVAVSMLLQLKALGIQLSIDDFGTGYSSLAYLQRFPIHTLKIDRSFINGLEIDKEKMEIVRTILSLARTLRMDVVAEGVETFKQLSRLKQLNCDYGQGYLFSKPLNKNAAKDLLKNPALMWENSKI